MKASVEYRTALSLDQKFEDALLELASRLFHCRQSGKAIVGKLPAFFTFSPPQNASNRELTLCMSGQPSHHRYIRTGIQQTAHKGPSQVSYQIDIRNLTAI